MKITFLLIITLFAISTYAQQKSFYYNIPPVPAEYTPETVVARMVDGLGFRYYWATEGLTLNDLNYKPTDSSRKTIETIEHIFGLTQVILNTVSNKINNAANAQKQNISFEDMRTATLLNIQTASEILKYPSAKIKSMEMVLERTKGNSAFPFWNLINGPIEDAIWHVGQVVSFRRSSGNPLPNGVNVLEGTKK